MTAPLPKSIIVGPEQHMPVVESDFTDEPEVALGYFDGEKIAIWSQQHPVGKHAILLHEMVHVAEEKMRQMGIDVKLPEEYVESLSGTLFIMLAASGLWNGVTPKEALAWVVE